ncbi:MAG: Maf family protein [Burkholderiales bacterium]|jgi:septum formation protein
MPRLILASSSRYRRELLARLGLGFECMSPDIDEQPRAGETAEAVARRLALEKAQAIARQNPDALVIGSDQTATIDGSQIIGKPGTHERAIAQLQSASGRTLTFHTGLCVWQTGQEPLLDCVSTFVRFRVLADDEIERYLRAEQPYDCAGSAKSEGLGVSLLHSQDGSDPTALIGLPLIRLCAMLRQRGLVLP